MTITYTFAPLQIIFASRFNTNFSDVKSWADAHELINSNIHGITGSFIDTGTANQVSSVPKTFNILSTNSPSFSSNARLSLSGAGVLSLLGANGSAPSVTNPVFFNVRDGLGGWTQIAFTSTTNCTIADASSADSFFYNGSGTPWGTTTTRPWGATPFGVYVTTDGITPALFISRSPILTYTPILAQDFGYKNNPPSVAGTDNVFFWTATNITVSHALKPCQLIGTIIMSKNASDDWTISALGSSGIGAFGAFGTQSFEVSAGHNGAASGKFFIDNGGTAATYTSTSTFYYTLGLDGVFHGNVTFVNAAGGTAGAGAVALLLAVPFAPNIPVDLPLGDMRLVNNGALATTVNLIENSGSFGFYYQSVAATTTAVIQNANQDQTVRSIIGSFRYRAY